METQVQKIMRVLDLTEEEARKVIEDDKAVDRMKDSEVNSDLTTEQQAAAKKARQADRKKPFVPDLKKRERKENPTKAGIVAEIAKFLQENSEYCPEKVEISNKERQIDFKIGDLDFSITLTQHRKAKK